MPQLSARRSSGATYEANEAFYRALERLSADQQRRFGMAVGSLVKALKQQPPAFPAPLRVKRVQGHPGIWELTFAPDGRATFEYGDELTPGEPHVIWRRVGDHSILRAP